jgi:DNA-binding Lrp family transcriptional regulator
VKRPFAAIAAELAITEAQVLQRLVALRHGPDGIIRQISAIF